MDIPFDRIQSISFEQNPIHQLFDVVRLKIDTAGSSREEFEFSALEKTKATDLRDFILSQKSPVVTEPGMEEETSGKLILTLTVTDLIKIGVSQNHLRTAGIILAFVLGLRDRIEDALGETYVDRFDHFTEDVVNNAFTMGLMVFAALIIVSFFGTLLLTVLRYYDLHAWKTPDGYKVKSGLLNKREQSAPDHKIQVLRWISNPIKRWFGIVSLRFYQASSIGVPRSSTLTIPGCTLPKLASIQQSYFSEDYNAALPSFGVRKEMFYRRLLYLGVLPFLVLFSVSLFLKYYDWMILSILWLIVCGIFQWYNQKKWKYYINEKVLQTSYGVLENVNKAIYFYKVQSVEIKQTPYQRRKALANMVFHTAGGVVQIPYLPLERALQLKNYTLFQIESSTLKWM
jgi:putative membrane protein